MVGKILRFTKVEHTFFSLPLIFAGAWAGAENSFPTIKVILLITLAALGARTFGMAFNRIFDKNIDALNPRTICRELPSGRLSLKTAFTVAFSGCALYLFACFFLGRLCILLSWLPLLLLLLYSLLKRFTWLCHFGVGICLGIAPIGAFVAASGHLQLSANILIFSFFVFLWMSGADIIYALLDVASDKKNGIYSLPARFGPIKGQVTAAALHLAAFISIMFLIVINNGSIEAYIAAAVSAAAFLLMYLPKIPIIKKFFPISTIAGIAGSIAIFLL